MSSIKLAIDGIHAILVVFSIRNRIFEEEKHAISSLQGLFGKGICDYMIVVFTGADELEEDDKTLEDFLYDCPQALKEIICLCGNRVVLLDNKTDDQTKKSNQVHQLLSLVSMVLEKNGGEPYTHEIFTEMKKWNKELPEPTEEFQVLKKTKRYSEQELLEPRDKIRVEHLKPTIGMAARLKVGENDETARKKAEEDIATLRGELKINKAGLRKELKIDKACLRVEQRQEIANLSEELKKNIARLRGELKKDIASSN